MEIYWKVCGAVLIALVLILCLRGKEMAALLALLVCAMTTIVALGFLKPVMELVQQLAELGNLNSQIMGILLKAAGIGLVSEIAAQICSDSGNASLGKTLQLLGSAVILWLSVPLFTMLMELLQSILGEL